MKALFLASVTSKKILMNGIVPSILKGESETELTASVLRKKRSKTRWLDQQVQKKQKKSIKGLKSDISLHLVLGLAVCGVPIVCMLLGNAESTV